MDKKLASFFCDPKTVVKNIAILLLMIFVVVYAAFQILPSFSEKLKTETTLEVTVFDANETTGYIFRDELPIIDEANNDRVVVTLVKDGERVSKGQHFANAYVAEDYADIQDNIDVIDAKIEVLEKSSVEADAYVTDLSKVDKDIDTNFGKIYSAVSEGSLANVNNIENELLVDMNKRNLIINMSDSYENELNALKSEKTALQNRISAYSYKVTAQSSGYYYGDTDGFERIFDVKLVDELDHAGFRELIEKNPEQSVIDTNYGKIVKDFVWYVVCESDKTAAAKYEENKSYNLVFPSFSEDEMRLVLTRIVKSTSEDTVLLVFRGNTAPEGFNYTRSQQVNIISGEYSGYAVPKDAVRSLDNNKTKGVYILTGDIVRFRKIEIMSEDGDYYIVKIPSSDDYNSKSADDKDEKENAETEYKYLSLYDNIIIGGKDLFDGKIVG